MKNWAGNITYSPHDLVSPDTVEELQRIVRSARRVRALGTGHSFNTVADTTGTLVSTRRLLSPVLVDPARSVAVVPGGATFATVNAALHQQGWALPNLGSLPHISIAGACATGTHGSGSANGCLASAVVGIELVTADGELRTVHEGDPDFPGMVVSLGALGVVTRLWLRVEPSFDVSQEVLLDVKLSTVVEHAAEILASAYSVSLFTSFRDPGAIDSVWRKRRLDPEGKDGASGEGWIWGGRPATEAVFPILGMDAASATEQLGVPGPSHERLPHFRVEFEPSTGDELQSEFFVGLEHAGEVLELLGTRARAFAEALQVCEIRTIAADDLWISPFSARDTVAVHATWVSDLAVVRPALTALEDLLAAYSPRPHWGKVFVGFDAARMADCYPALPDFRALAERLDPERCFSNDFLEGLGVR